MMGRLRILARAILFEFLCNYMTIGYLDPLGGIAAVEPNHVYDIASMWVVRKNYSPRLWESLQ